jgi:hypothetical protein
LVAIFGSIVMSLVLSTMTSYVLIIFVACIYGVFISPIIPLLDTTTLSILGRLRITHFKRATIPEA